MPRLRIFTWVILAINVLFLAWIIAGAASAGSDTSCAHLHGDELSACQAGGAIGTGIGVALILGLWVAVDIILAIAWFITRPKLRICPRCGTGVKKGRTVCRKCHYDFALAYRQDAAMPYPQQRPEGRPPEQRH